MRLATFTVCLAAAGTAIAAPPTHPDDQYLYGLTKAHLARVPAAEEYRAARGKPMADVQRGVLASEEYFRRLGSDAGRYTEGVFIAIGGREPRGGESAYWQSRFRRYRGDRARFVREVQQRLVSSSGALESLSAPVTRRAYTDLLGRAPNTAEYAAQRGRCPAQIRSAVLGSADYAQRNAGDAERVVTSWYHDVRGVDPTPAELRSWSLRYSRAGGGRAALAREFIDALPVPGRADAAQPAADAELVNQLYRRFLDRAPERWEARYWAGKGPVDLHAHLMGSAAYYSAHGGRPREWVKDVYTQVIGRAPSTFELESELSDLAGVSSDRVEYVKGLMGRALSGPAPGTPAGPAVPGGATVTPETLVSLGRIMVEVTRLDLAGSRSARAVLGQAQAVLTASEAVLSEARRNTSPRELARRVGAAATDLERFEHTLASAPGSAPHAERVARRYAAALDAYAATLGGTSGPALPPVRVPAGSDRFDATAFRPRLRDLREDVRRAEQLAERLAGTSSEYAQLLRDTEAFDSRLSELRWRSRRGATADQLKADALSLWAASRNIYTRAARSPTGSLRQSWWAIERKSRILASSLGVSAKAGTTPVVPAARRRDTGVIRAVDVALTQIQLAERTFSWQLLRVPDLARLAGELRTLNAELLRLRGLADGGESRSALQRAYAAVAAQYRDANAVWARGVGRVPAVYRTPQYAGLARAMADLNRELN